MVDIREGVNAQTKNFGIEVIDVRIRRADLAQQNSDAIYRRMQQERVREANEFRAQGEQISQEIRSKADRDATVIVAEATRQGEITRGQGDGEKNRIFAEAFGQDPDFFGFYRSMNAYQLSLKGDNTTVILSPDSEFFRYFNGGAAAGGRRLGWEPEERALPATVFSVSHSRFFAGPSALPTRPPPSMMILAAWGKKRT